MLPLLLLLALPSSLLAAAEGRPARQEEVNVLVYGVLQLRQALSDTYRSTTDKLQRVLGRQGRHESSLERLQGEAGRARREEERLRGEVERLKMEEREVRLLSRRIEGELQELQRGHGELQRRVRALQGTQEQQEGSPALKAQTERQHLALQVIAEAVAQQQEQLAQQRRKLKNILRQVSPNSLR